MAIFGRKFDRERDSLVTEFDPVGKKFVFLLGDEIIADDRLNVKSKNYLKLMNDELITNPAYLSSLIARTEIDEVIKKSDERIKFLSSVGYNKYGFRHLVGTALQGTISQEVLEFLMPLIKDEHILVGIHRVKGITSDDSIEDILLNGLLFFGHQGGMVVSKVKLEDHVSYYESNRFILNELILAYDYKDASGSILIAIPFEDLGKDLFVRNNDEIRLNPKYIVGYFPVADKNIDSFVTPEQIKECMRERLEDCDPYIPGETVSLARDTSHYKSR